MSDFPTANREDSDRDKPPADAKLGPRPRYPNTHGQWNKLAQNENWAYALTQGMEHYPYRHRCVEAWSMTVPWSGFALKALVDFAKPLGKAKYLRMETLADPNTMPSLKQTWYPWPYIEGLTIAEATNELAFIATGLYGKPMPKQNGAPLRLTIPWKYGFKSAKSIVTIRFVEKEPATAWNLAAPHEYGFYSNVNPTVNHPRWSQASERRIGDFFRRKTLMFNGYGSQVAHLYKGMNLEELY